MDRVSQLSSRFARMLGTTALAVALGAPYVAAAQAADVAAEPAETGERLSRRERRRAAEEAAPAPAPRAGQAALAGAAEAVDERLVCKSIKSLGTKVARRVCATPEQWAATERRSSNDAQEGMRQIRERTAVGGANVPTGASAP